MGGRGRRERPTHPDDLWRQLELAGLALVIAFDPVPLDTLSRAQHNLGRREEPEDEDEEPSKGALAPAQVRESGRCDVGQREQENQEGEGREDPHVEKDGEGECVRECGREARWAGRGALRPQRRLVSCQVHGCGRAGPNGRKCTVREEERDVRDSSPTAQVPLADDVELRTAVPWTRSRTSRGKSRRRSRNKPERVSKLQVAFTRFEAAPAADERRPSPHGAAPRRSKEDSSKTRRGPPSATMAERCGLRVASRRRERETEREGNLHGTEGTARGGRGGG